MLTNSHRLRLHWRSLAKALENRRISLVDGILECKYMPQIFSGNTNFILLSEVEKVSYFNGPLVGSTQQRMYAGGYIPTGFDKGIANEGIGPSLKAFSAQGANTMKKRLVLCLILCRYIWFHLQ